MRFLSRFLSRFLHSFLHPLVFYKASTVLARFAAGIFLFCFTYGLYVGLFVVPLDYQQGDAFRIIYIHVPVAALSLTIYAAMGVFSFIYLVYRIRLAAILCLACAPVGALYTFLALVTGAIWGKPMWGCYWVWDARLTSELFLLFIYIGYLSLYKSIPRKENAFKACSVLTLIGLVDLPVIHFSVNWWHTLHQGATVFKFGKASISPAMQEPLIFMLIAFAMFAVLVVMLKARVLLLSHERDSSWVRKIVCNI